MKAKGQQLVQEYERQLKIIHSARLFDCIVHHVYKTKRIPESELIKDIYDCKIGSAASPPAVIGPREFIEYLDNEGILDRFMIPGDNRWYYQLSPVGRYTVEEMIKKYGEKFNHPKLETKPN